MVNTLGRNDSCFCGSGRKYKHCHFNRKNEVPLPMKAIEHQVRQGWELKQCLHPHASRQTCGRIVDAHTIQRAGTLKLLIDDSNQVRSFYPLIFDQSGSPIVHKVGWKKASTFTGFCHVHDQKLFAPLETSPFVASSEQCFLIAYRALCHELYQKSAAARSMPIIRNLADRGYMPAEQRRIQHTFDVMNAGTQKGLESLNAEKWMLDRQLLDRDFSAWSRLTITFKGDICIASTGTPTPNFDLDGNPIQILHDPNTPLQHLFYSIVPVEEGGVVIFTWMTKNEAPRRFVDSLTQLPASLLPDILIQFMFAYVENTFFSDKWWMSLTDPQRKHIMYLAANTNPYYDLPEYRRHRFAPWTITDIGKL